MASITSYASENSLILGNREAFYRQFNFGSWNELRIGMLFRFVGNSSDTSSYSNETVTVTTLTDKLYFGLKSTGSNMPGVSGTNFIGSATINTTDLSAANVGTYYYNAGNTYALYLMATSGSATSQSIFTNNTGGTQAMTYPSYPFSTTNYDGFYGLKFTLQNSGSVSQSIALSYKRNADNSGSGSADLHSLLISDSSWSTMPQPNSASWVPSISIPDCFFVYSPFYNNRIRMSAVEVIKVS